MGRETKKENILPDIDITVPIDKSKIVIDEDSCLGKEWSLSSPECPICAMLDICGTLYQDRVNLKVKEISDPEKPFLDETDFRSIDRNEIFEFCKNLSGKLTVQELVQKIMKAAKTMDEIAVVEWIKAFKVEYDLKFRAGIVWEK